MCGSTGFPRYEAGRHACDCLPTPASGEYGGAGSPRIKPGAGSAHAAFRPISSAAFGAPSPHRVAPGIDAKPVQSLPLATPGVPKAQRLPGNAGRARVAGWASPLFSQGILKHRFVERQIDDQAFEIPVLALELFQATDLGHTHPGVNPFPATKVWLRPRPSCGRSRRQSSRRPLASAKTRSVRLKIVSSTFLSTPWLKGLCPKIRSQFGPVRRVRVQVWADTAYRSIKNEEWLEENGYVSDIHRKKPKGRPMSQRTSRANGRRSAVRSKVEHVFARQKGPMRLFIRTIGLVRAKVKIGMAQPGLQSHASRLASAARCARMTAKSPPGTPSGGS